MSSRFAFAYAAPFVLLCGSAWVGCATTKAGATPEDLARAHDQAAPGATLFANECASCHGGRGEGLASAPAILGARRAARVSARYRRGGRSDDHRPPAHPDPGADAASGRPLARSVRNAQDLYTFTTTHLPKSRRGQSQGRRLLGRGGLHARRTGSESAARRARPRECGLDTDSQALR